MLNKLRNKIADFISVEKPGPVAITDRPYAPYNMIVSDFLGRGGRIDFNSLVPGRLPQQCHSESRNKPRSSCYLEKDNKRFILIPKGKLSRTKCCGQRMVEYEKIEISKCIHCNTEREFKFYRPNFSACLNCGHLIDQNDDSGDWS